MKTSGRLFKSKSAILCVAVAWLGFPFAAPKLPAAEAESRVAVLLVDTDHMMGKVDENIYGQFLEHINHSVEGLFAEQIQGRGFEGTDFQTYWKPFATNGSAEVVAAKFQNGGKSLLLQAEDGIAGVRQDGIYLQQGHDYNGSVWLKPGAGALRLKFQVKSSAGKLIAAPALETSGTNWQESSYSFFSPQTDANATIEIAATGTGATLADYISMMRADLRTNGMLRPDLFGALRDLKPAFIRWPGGSFASTYRWQDGIGPFAARGYHPNEIWGGYSDYYSFGTEEFMELCRRLGAEPLVVLAATNTDPAQVQYAMNWVHYLNDAPATKWGRLRSANGHREPYGVKYFQIDNEPMNFGLSPEHYADIVKVFGKQLRKAAPHAKIVACGQKRSNDLEWSQKLVDIAGDDFDILGCHNYEYENDNFETGVRRIENYLVKLRDYIHRSRHPQIKLAVLEWSLCRTYDWRAGLHAAGSLIAYEKLSPDLAMTCPALLMRNTTDNPDWRAWIYHDPVSWFPGCGYLVEKLFREHYAEEYYASAAGTFRDPPNRGSLFDNISQMKPEGWKPDTCDAIATGSAKGRRIVIKAVNYANEPATLLARLRGSGVPEDADVRIYSLTASLTDAPDMTQPDKIKPVVTTQPYARDLAIELKPHAVAVVEITAHGWNPNR